MAAYSTDEHYSNPRSDRPVFFGKPGEHWHVFENEFEMFARRRRCHKALLHEKYEIKGAADALSVALPTPVPAGGTPKLKRVGSGRKRKGKSVIVEDDTLDADDEGGPAVEEPVVTLAERNSYNE
ncbi:MAG: hypothetical protein CMH98_01545, partial [Oceanospirillaceae bacterium]|nr:hypothetical protein [Oceanospirillaceae bacterium]